MICVDLCVVGDECVGGVELFCDSLCARGKKVIKGKQKKIILCEPFSF